MQHLSSLLARVLVVVVVVVFGLSLMMHDSSTNLISWPARAGFESPPSLNMSLSGVFFPVHDSPGANPVAHENSKMLHTLVTCMEQRNCHQNQTRVVILAASPFRDYLQGSRGGESIWARSTTLALTNMGYTLVYTPYPSLLHAVQFYRMFPDLVKLVLMDDHDTFSCHHDRQNCILSGVNPTGIAPWKIFSFAFWPGSHNPLGLRWTLSPENYTAEGLSESTYLGYSIEESCRRHLFVPHHEREDQAWILAKYLHYFTPKFDAAWSQADFDAVTTATGIKFAMGSVVNDYPELKPDLPSTHVNYGRINQTTFISQLSKSRVLIGMSNPVLSPTPYEALCLGVPFINPIKNWDHDNPTDTSRWQTQHNGLRDLGPPYIYNVFKGDTQGFTQAVKDALANPIESYVLPRMTMSAIEERLGAILETDWRHEVDLQADKNR